MFSCNTLRQQTKQDLKQTQLLVVMQESCRQTADYKEESEGESLVTQSRGLFSLTREVISLKLLSSVILR